MRNRKNKRSCWSSRNRNTGRTVSPRLAGLSLFSWIIIFSCLCCIKAHGNDNEDVQIIESLDSNRRLTPVLASFFEAKVAEKLKLKKRQKKEEEQRLKLELKEIATKRQFLAANAEQVPWESRFQVGKTFGVVKLCFGTQPFQGSTQLSAQFWIVRSFSLTLPFRAFREVFSSRHKDSPFKQKNPHHGQSNALSVTDKPF